MNIIWSGCHTSPLLEQTAIREIDRAADEGAAGYEMSGRGIGAYIACRAFPELAATIDAAALAQKQALLARLVNHAKSRGLRFGLWHHEVDGPHELLQRLPALKAPDGLIDLDSPLLYRLITGRIAEFFDLFPGVDELVLTLTETGFPVFRRPFCPIPVPERVRRVIQAILEATEPRGKQLVIRPFSAVREDEIFVREAVLALKTRRLSMMYKTEPFDWHPFLANETLIGSVPGLEARAETDAAAEYYGQGAFPCSYTAHLERRLAAAREKGASTMVIRVDRGGLHSALGQPVNEGNVIAVTRWLKNPDRPLETHWLGWCRERHGAAPPALYPLLEKTFDVICRSLYIDGSAFTHNLFPPFNNAMHVQAFGLFEEKTPLTHMKLNWGILHDRTTLTHEALLAEKEDALTLARKIGRDFDRTAAGLPDAARREIGDALQRLPCLAEACLLFCRLTLAHLQEVWRRTPRLTDSFADEAVRFRALADRIERELGREFWFDMPGRMRSIPLALEAQRASELPVRKEIESLPGLVDYVLCGYASEGHRLQKLLHSGHTLQAGDRWIRATGRGPDEGIGYTLACKPGRPHRLTVQLAGNDNPPAPGMISAGAETFPLPPAGGFSDQVFALKPTASDRLDVRLWGATPAPVRIARILLQAIGPKP